LTEFDTTSQPITVTSQKHEMFAMNNSETSKPHVLCLLLIFTCTSYNFILQCTCTLPLLSFCNSSALVILLSLLCHCYPFVFTLPLLSFCHYSSLVILCHYFALVILLSLLCPCYPFVITLPLLSFYHYSAFVIFLSFLCHCSPFFITLLLLSFCHSSALVILCHYSALCTVLKNRLVSSMHIWNCNVLSTLFSSMHSHYTITHWLLNSTH
jgi:hypothetical protein